MLNVLRGFYRYRARRSTDPGGEAISSPRNLLSLYYFYFGWGTMRK